MMGGRRTINYGMMTKQSVIIILIIMTDGQKGYISLYVIVLYNIRVGRRK